MFEDYLIDSYHLAVEARDTKDERASKRYYRASIFYAISAIEAFINFIGDTLSKGEKTAQYEIAFLIGRKFGVVKDKFKITNQIDYTRLEDKLKYIIYKHVSDYNFEKESSWIKYCELKKFRDSLVHPRKDEDDISLIEYDDKIKDGLNSIIEIINHICKGLFGRQLRRKILDMNL